MGTAINTRKLLLALTLLALHPNAESVHWPPGPPLCTSQIALVNHACSILPFTPVPPPSPAGPPEAPPGRHHHRHGHEREHRETPVQGECCRWLKEVDSTCVCRLLVNLPPFLTRPRHNYTVVVDDSCTVTFACSSRLVQL